MVQVTTEVTISVSKLTCFFAWSFQFHTISWIFSNNISDDSQLNWPVEILLPRRGICHHCFLWWSWRFGKAVGYWLKLDTWISAFFERWKPPKTNMAPENRYLEEEISILKPLFWGSMLVFRSVLVFNPGNKNNLQLNSELEVRGFLCCFLGCYLEPVLQGLRGIFVWWILGPMIISGSYLLMNKQGFCAPPPPKKKAITSSKSVEKKSAITSSRHRQACTSCQESPENEQNHHPSSNPNGTW